MILYVDRMARLGTFRLGLRLLLALVMYTHVYVTGIQMTTLGADFNLAGAKSWYPNCENSNMYAGLCSHFPWT